MRLFIFLTKGIYYVFQIKDALTIPVLCSYKLLLSTCCIPRSNQVFSQIYTCIYFISLLALLLQVHTNLIFKATIYFYSIPVVSLNYQLKGFPLFLPPSPFTFKNRLFQYQIMIFSILSSAKLISTKVHIFRCIGCTF